MIYDWRHHGGEPEAPFGVLYDAQGVAYTHVLNADTETGEIVQCLLDDKGVMQLDSELDPETGDTIVTALTKRFKAPAPLMFVPDPERN